MIKPGEEFTIDIEGERFTVVALTLDGQRQLAKLLRSLREVEQQTTADALAAFDLVAEAMSLCMPDDTDQINRVDATMAMQIAYKTLNKQALSEDEQKK